MRWWMLAGLLLAGCSGGTGVETEDGGGDADGGQDAGSAATTLEHTFPAFTVAPGEEISGECQSWTLRNEQPLFVNEITAVNGGAWHHSNWTFVRESSFRGPDGTWRCSDRGYDEVAGGLNGGVFFAQSTQAAMETQAFPPGTAIRLPPFTRVVGGVHLLNVTPEPIESAMRFEVRTLDEADVHTRLMPMSFSYYALTIPPRSQARFSMECDVASAYRDQLGREPDFRVYYVLPHYHELGRYFRLELVGGARDGEVVYETGAAVGDVLGSTLDPPVDVAGATALRMTCGFENPRDEAVVWGIGDQEMCVMLAFTDSPLKLVGYTETNTVLGETDGIVMNEGPCRAFGVTDF